MDSQILWEIIIKEISQEASNEPILASFLHLTVLKHKNLSEVLAFQLSSKLSSLVMDSRFLYEIFIEILNNDKKIIKSVIKDICAYYERDAACNLYSMPLLYFKGFHALQTHRINHYLWNCNRKTLALFLQNRSSEIFGVDIHPAARIGNGIMIDHGTGVVIGETAVLGDDISLMHGVTLGGSGKVHGDRHPKISNGVMIGANSSVLGNIRIGRCCKIGAGSVVVSNISDYVTVVGVPARVIGIVKHIPSQTMDQNFNDYEI